jgi:hypothetical protein
MNFKKLKRILGLLKILKILFLIKQVFIFYIKGDNSVRRARMM